MARSRCKTVSQARCGLGIYKGCNHMTCTMCKYNNGMESIRAATGSSELFLIHLYSLFLASFLHLFVVFVYNYVAMFCSTHRSGHIVVNYLPTFVVASGWVWVACLSGPVMLMWSARCITILPKCNYMYCTNTHTIILIVTLVVVKYQILHLLHIWMVILVQTAALYPQCFRVEIEQQGKLQWCSTMMRG